ncbi:excisionase [Paucibacter sp. JuS9]|uniref:excisionase n=1 Tax=Paucibacter sp. JuS9 TaxID=3228748 RepID=UPI003756C0CE
MSAYLLPLQWVRLAKYCELSGDTSDAVHARRRKRQWTDGVHCRIGPDGNVWINLSEVNKWVESRQQNASWPALGA